MINLGGEADSLIVVGDSFLKIYQAMLETPAIDEDGADNAPTVRLSEHERYFCGECGSHLWAYNPKWPELIHPVASAIDNPLPSAPGHVHMMLGSAVGWARPEPSKATDEYYEAYPATSLADWHKKRGY